MKQTQKQHDTLPINGADALQLLLFLNRILTNNLHSIATVKIILLYIKIVLKRMNALRKSPNLEYERQR